jgi:hypothetical protein
LVGHGNQEGLGGEVMLTPRTSLSANSVRFYSTSVARD